MTFVVKKNRLTWYPVTVKTLSDERPGELDEHRIEVQYEVFTRDEYLDLVAKWSAGGSGNLAAFVMEFTRTPEQREEMKNELRKRVKNIRGLIDEEGAPLEFTSQLLDGLLEDTPVYKAVDVGLFSASQGVPVKNS